MLKTLASKTQQKNLISHKTVLLQVACDFLAVKPGQKYIDATYGGGGHSAEIVRRGGQVLTIDQDPEAEAEVQDNFSNLTKIANDHNWKQVAGILFDLGVSQHQFDTAARGFSIQQDGPLDMRMGDSGVSAADIVNLWPAEQLTKIFQDYGEIPAAKSLAQKIVDMRPFATTLQLAEVTKQWARQAFQSIRIAVNDELGVITQVLPQAFELLQPGGRIVIISFHSLEDRIVKNQFRLWENQNLGVNLTSKPVDGEKKSKLRAFEKI